ncbi:MAG TPA: antibiotic biosynthesis monooxygenase [Candidatus Aquabacterium excrementipullorum]|nr:antibiotic biosynthesis monooxygenase [Candidatus Aquabacterium excrementipullorum]
MVGIVATLKVKQGQQALFEEVANQLVAASRAEPGCLEYTLWRTDDSTVYVFVERYQSPEAIEAHKKSDHYRQLGRQLAPFLETAPELKMLVSATS